jgi:PAS domain S-box-containing protein
VQIAAHLPQRYHLHSAVESQFWLFIHSAIPPHADNIISTMKADLPNNETERLERLKALQILDTPDEEALDNLVELAANLFKTPIALISLIDKERQWFKARIGLEAQETHRDLAFCAHAIHQNQVFVVEDARNDRRFFDNPLVTADPNIRFYAGAPLIDSAGFKLGTLCIIDTVPRSLDAQESLILEGLAREVVLHFKLRTELKRAEENASLFRTISATAPVMIWTSGQNGLMNYFNNSWLNFSGRTLEQELGNGWAQSIHSEDRERTLNTYRLSLEQRTPFEIEFRLRRHDGSYRWVVNHGTPHIADNGDFRGFVGACLDIDNQREIAVQLAESKERFELAISGSNDGIWDWVDVNKDTEWWSARFYNLLGYENLEIPATLSQFSALLHPEDLQQTMDAVRANHTYNEPFDIVYRLRTKSGVYRWFRARANTIRDHDGKPVRMAGSITDMTKQRQIEENLQAALLKAESATEAKTQFLANMSHEIRTPLSAIIGFAEAAKEADISPEDRRQSLETILSSGKHLLGLINDILDLSKIDAGAMTFENQRIVPTLLIEEARLLLAERASEKTLALTTTIHWPIPQYINSDALRLKQILINLIGNAIKFTNSGIVEVILDFNLELKRLVFSIKDSGIGMTSEQAKKLFKRFSQADESVMRRFGGTGLGLTICAQLVEKMGGEISFESSYQVGSTFTFWIPVNEEDCQNLITSISKPIEQQTILTQNLDGLKGKILIADDSPQNRKLLEVMLKKSCLELTFVERGDQALEQIGKQTFDLILMDIQMPEMDGYAATRRMRDQGIKTPIVALTANTSNTDIQKCQRAGCNAHLGKPFYKRELFSLITKLLTTPS